MTGKIQEILAKFPSSLMLGRILFLLAFLVLLIGGIICLFNITSSGEKIYIIPALVCFLFCILISRQIDKSKKKERREGTRQEY
jgi:hypothetical protein